MSVEKLRICCSFAAAFKLVLDRDLNRFRVATYRGYPENKWYYYFSDDESINVEVETFSSYGDLLARANSNDPEIVHGDYVYSGECVLDDRFIVGLLAGVNTVHRYATIAILSGSYVYLEAYISDELLLQYITPSTAAYKETCNA